MTTNSKCVPFDDFSYSNDIHITSPQIKSQHIGPWKPTPKGVPSPCTASLLFLQHFLPAEPT